MTRPTIRFLQQRDGRRLAYAVHGEGPPLVCPAWWVSHLEDDWEQPGFRELFDGLARHHTVVRYDRPGSGLSDRTRETVDLDGEVATLGELIEHLGLGPCALFAFSCAGPTALAYAATDPARVSHLVFFGSFLRGRDVGPSEMKDALQALVRAHWGMGSRAITNLFAPDLPDTDVKRMNERYRRTATPEMAAQLLALTFEMDAGVVARSVNVPALVLHRKGDQTIRHAAGRELAAALPDAAFETLEGSAHVPWIGDVAAVRDAVTGFLGTAGVGAADGTVGAGDRTLRKHGDVWALTFGGRTAHVKHARGMTDLAILLTRAGEEIHVGTLWSGADSAAALGGESDPVLDEQALADYGDRLRELEAAIEEAESLGHAERAETCREEKDALARELRTAVGLGGRARGLGEPSERARKAVTARIRAAIKKIGEVHPPLGTHLDEAVTTGNFCRYAPDPPESWALTELPTGR